MKNLKPLLLFLCTGFLQTALGQDTTTKTTSYQQTADDLLTQVIENKHCVGITAGFNRDGVVKWTGGAGRSGLSKQNDFGPATLTRTASIAKPMTAVAILQLYEQGKIDLDQPIRQYLPHFPQKAKGDITVRHLLTHSSGVGGYQKKEARNTNYYATLTDAAAVFQGRPLQFAPGSSFQYTSYGYVLLGLIIEQASGMSYGEYMQQNIWTPAGMTHTGIEVATQAYPHKSKPYHRSDRGKIKDAKSVDLSNRIPGGGIYSTVDDLLKFGNALLSHSLIKAETLDMMTQNTGLKKEGSPYGMGCYLYAGPPEPQDVFGHTGGQLGCSAMMLLIPKWESTIVVLSNTSGALQEVSNTAMQLLALAKTATP